MTRDPKKSISLRLSGADRRKIQGVAERLHVRESDVLRFCIQHVLAKLAPLHDAHAHGAALMPVFIELGPEFVRFFALDHDRIEAILSAGSAEGDRRVDRFDIELLAGAGGPEAYSRARLREVVDLADADADTGKALRRYLYRKYVADFDGAVHVRRAPLGE